jgi:TonB-dependent receptor
MRFDFKADRRSEFQLSFGLNEHKHGRYRPRPLIVAGTANTALSDPDPLFTVINGARAGIQDEYRKRDNDRVFANFRGEHRFGTFRVDYDASYDRSERLENMALTNWTSNKRFNYALDRRPGSGSMEFPVIRVIAGPAFPAPAATTVLPATFPGTNSFADDFSNVGAATLNVFDLNTDSRITGGRINVAKTLELRWPIELKTGIRYRNERISADREQFVGNLNLTALGNNLNRFLREDWDLGAGNGRYPVANVASIHKVLAASKLQYVGGADPRTRFSFDPAVATITPDTTVRNSLFLDRELEETLHAGFVQGQLTAGRLKLLTGVRAERTQMERHGAVRNQNLTDLVAQYSGRQRTEKSYTSYFPSAHLRYAFRPNLILHSSYSTSIGRPNYPDLVAGAEVNNATKVITVPNLDLRPQRSKNYDLSLEYYFEPVGVVSVGLFQKDITDFPLRSRVSFPKWRPPSWARASPIRARTVDDWRVTNKINGGSGRARGIELSYNQQFSFLPALWRGFGVFANYTYVDAEGSYKFNGVRTEVQLEEYVPKTMNAGLSYALGRGICGPNTAGPAPMSKATTRRIPKS